MFLVDRAKDMIVTGGENVYSTEVEEVLYRHPAVLEAAVFGVPDERWGEAVHAVVVPRTDVTPDELLEHCRACHRRLQGAQADRAAHRAAAEVGRRQGAQARPARAATGQGHVDPRVGGRDHRPPVALDEDLTSTSTRSTTSSPTGCERYATRARPRVCGRRALPGRSSRPAAAIDAERQRCRRTRRGLEIAAGRVRRATCWRTRAPASTCCTRCRSRDRRRWRTSTEFRRTGHVDLGPILLDRDGVGRRVTIQNHALLNAEDDHRRAPRSKSPSISCCSTTRSTSASLRGAPATHPKYERPAHLRRRHQPHAPVLRQDLAGRVHARARARCVSKMYRGHDRRRSDAADAGATAGEAVDRRRRDVRHRRRLPVAPRDGPRDRRARQPTSTCLRARRGSSPAAPTSAFPGSSARA